MKHSQLGSGVAFGCASVTRSHSEEKKKSKYSHQKSSLPGRHENTSFRGAGSPGGLSGIEVISIGPGIAKHVHTQFCYFFLSRYGCFDNVTE
jgi:hypothetical protein